METTHDDGGGVKLAVVYTADSRASITGLTTEQFATIEIALRDSARLARERGYDDAGDAEALLAALRAAPRSSSGETTIGGVK